MTNIVLYGGNEKDPRVGGGVDGTSAKYFFHSITHIIICSFRSSFPSSLFLLHITMESYFSNNMAKKEIKDQQENQNSRYQGMGKKIQELEVKEVLKMMGNDKTIEPHNIPIDILKVTGEKTLIKSQNCF
ncbi:hypothetical protein Lal_00024324 [Lupinus albus]|nr:hypothetical protein Lal_00024324 [Lupinus albus]